MATWVWKPSHSRCGVRPLKAGQPSTKSEPKMENGAPSRQRAALSTWLCLLHPFRPQYWQKLIRMPVEPQAPIQFHVHCNLRALRLTKSITQFEEPVSLPHITPLFLFRCRAVGGASTGWPVSRRNGSAPSRPHAAPSLGGKSLELSRELLEQSPPITATSTDPEVFVSSRCIRVR